MVRITVHNNLVDFEAPVNMNEEQREKFLDFMKGMFGDSIEIKDVEELEKEQGDRTGIEMKKWSVDDYCALFGPDDNETVARKLNRTEMGVKMKRGTFVPEFMIWVKKKDYSLPPQHKHMKEFLEERGE